MKDNELNALITLLDDEDNEVISHVEERIKSLGTGIIPYLEKQWEENFNPTMQRRIEDLIHGLQFELLNERFIDWRDTDEQDLLHGLWLISTYQYPDLELEDLQKEFEELYVDVWREFRNDLSPFDQVKILNSVIFDKFKFRANTKNFHSPANSMINTVLESKKGNPISLSSVYMILAKKLDLPIYGVNLPNLFILTYKTEQIQFYINVFNRGLIFSKDDIDNYIQHLQLEARESYFQPCSTYEIIVRYLRNLVVAFEKLDDYHKSDEVKTILQRMDIPYVD